MDHWGWGTVLVACALLAGCSSSDDAAAPPTTSTQPAATTPASTTTPTTTTTTTTTAAACEFDGAQTEQRVDFPELVTSEIGADVRTGVHECYERIVIELQAGIAPITAGLPGWLVRYADGPVTLGQTDDQFVELDGNADLLITMNAWMQTFDSNNTAVGYAGPRDLHPSGTTAIREMRLVDDFEGQSTWAVGVDHRRDFRVFTLTGPDRLVVDIAT